jgi:hypothetical protein
MIFPAKGYWSKRIIEKLWFRNIIQKPLNVWMKNITFSIPKHTFEKDGVHEDRE